MKTTKEILLAAFRPDYRGHKFNENSDYWHARTVRRLMRRYAKECVKADREQILNHIMADDDDIGRVIMKTKIDQLPYPIEKS